MTEEDNIRKHVSNAENPFRVPEGYFEQFTGRLMQRLPQQNAIQTKRVRLFPKLLRYAAVLLVVAGIGVTVFLSQHKDTLAENAQQEQTSDENYVNEALDYAMVDNAEIAEYLTEAE